MNSQGGTYIQYGCGLSAPDGWWNFDASPTLRLQRMPVVSLAGNRVGPRFPANVEYGDVTKALPVKADSAQLVYCSHVLEHLALDDFRHALRETFRVLKPGGTFRMVLPDLEVMVERYLANRGDAQAAPQLMRDTILGQEARPRGVGSTLRDWLGNSQHRWMWDYAAMARELQDAGFVDVRRAELGDNPDPMLASVEDEDRWRDCLGMECRKPAEIDN